MWQQIIFICLVLAGQCACVDVLGGRKTRKKEDSSASTVVSILIPTILAIAVLVFCIVCYLRKRRERKLQSDSISAHERIKENAIPLPHTYQNTSPYEYGTPRMTLPTYEGFDRNVFTHDLDPPPYSESRIYPLHYDNPNFNDVNEPPTYAVHPEFDPHPPRLASRHSRNGPPSSSHYSGAIEQIDPHVTLHNDLYDSQIHTHNSRHVQPDLFAQPNQYNTHIHSDDHADTDDVFYHSSNHFGKENDMRSYNRPRSSYRQHHGSLSNRTNSLNSFQSSDSFSHHNSIPRTSSRQIRTPVEQSPFSRTRSRSSHRHRIHYHGNSSKSHHHSALKRSKSFHGNHRRKSVRFSNNLEDFHFPDNNECEMYRTRSMPNLSHN